MRLDIQVGENELTTEKQRGFFEVSRPRKTARETRHRKMIAGTRVTAPAYSAARTVALRSNLVANEPISTVATVLSLDQINAKPVP